MLISLSWQIDVKQWAAKHRKISKNISNDLINFFELAFKNARYPEESWFGIHEQIVSLVIGGIFLAAINLSNPDYGVCYRSELND